jgi:hypothetical protein
MRCFTFARRPTANEKHRVANKRLRAQIAETSADSRVLSPTLSNLCAGEPHKRAAADGLIEQEGTHS